VPGLPGGTAGASFAKRLTLGDSIVDANRKMRDSAERATATVADFATAFRRQGIVAEATADASGFAEHAAQWQGGILEGLQQFGKGLQTRDGTPGISESPHKSGKLEEALTPGGKGNITEMKVDGGLEVLYGINSELLPYATIQDKGGPIVPTHAKALAIPISEEARAMYEAAGGDLRSLDLFVLQTPTNAFLADKTTHEPLFVLKQSVTIKGSHYFSGAIEELEGADLPGLLEDAKTELATLWNSI
jgi:hypothetical protein